MSFCIVLLERIEKHSARKCRNVCLMPCTSIYYLLEFLENLEFCIDMICNLRFQALDVCTSISILCLLSSNDSLSLHFPLVSFALHRFHNNSKILCVCVCVRFLVHWCLHLTFMHIRQNNKRGCFERPNMIFNTTTMWYVSGVYDGIAKETRKSTPNRKKIEVHIV